MVVARATASICNAGRARVLTRRAGWAESSVPAQAAFAEGSLDTRRKEMLMPSSW